jgi:hypothetical protein
LRPTISTDNKANVPAWSIVDLRVYPGMSSIPADMKKRNAYHSVDIMVTSQRRGSCGGIGEDGESEGSRVFVTRG